MRLSFNPLIIGLLSAVLVGCAAVRRPATTVARPIPIAAEAGIAQTDSFGAERIAQIASNIEAVAADAPSDVRLESLIALTLERNPRLAQVGWAVETARGRAIQAGLYPNPTVSITGDELGDHTGPPGIWTAPLVSQEIITANKLGLSRSAALKEVDQATLAIIVERYRVITDVRQTYYEALAMQRRAETLTELVQLVTRSVEATEKLRKGAEASRLDLVQLEVDRERYRADLESTRPALPAAYRKLAASVGTPDLPITSVTGDLETHLPDYDLERIRTYVVSMHPEIRSAQIGVERAQLLARRAEVESVPNVTLSSGYIRQSQNKANDWTVGVSLPVPLWNRNQGNIMTAAAQLGESKSQVERTQNDLVNRVATAFGSYVAARDRADRYRTEILPRVRDAHKLAFDVYKGGQLEYLRVLQAQRTVADANLEFVKSLGEMWHPPPTWPG